MNSITQDMKYRQSLLTYAQKYSVSRSSQKHNKSRSCIYFWLEILSNFFDASLHYVLPAYTEHQPIPLLTEQFFPPKVLYSFHCLSCPAFGVQFSFAVLVIQPPSVL